MHSLRREILQHFYIKNKHLCKTEVYTKHTMIFVDDCNFVNSFSDYKDSSGIYQCITKHYLNICWNGLTMFYVIQTKYMNRPRIL